MVLQGALTNSARHKQSGAAKRHQRMPMREEEKQQMGKEIMDYQKNWVRLPLQTAHNVRELGGYPVKGGGQIAYHRFLRADDISVLSDADVEFLFQYGVRMILDLRSDAEAERAPDRLAGTDGVAYARIPFLGKDVTDATQVNLQEVELGLGTLYAGMLESKGIVKALFEAIERAPEGCVLFHCSAGKDRTGVLAMLLMSLAGADKQDCVTNYAQSFINLTRKADIGELLKRAEYAKYLSLMYSPPETIEICYDSLMKTYGSAENYLTACGLSPEQLEKVQRRLLAD